MGVLNMKLWEGVANAFRLFCQKVDFFPPLINQNDELEESESES